MHTLLRQSPYPGQSDALKAIVVTPSSLLGQASVGIFVVSVSC